MPYTSIEFEKTPCMEYTQLQIEEFFAQLLDVVAERTSDSRSASVDIVWGASSILRFPNWCLNGIDVGTHTLCIYHSFKVQNTLLKKSRVWTEV